MKLKADVFGLVAAMMTTIVVVSLICNLSAPAYESAGCEADEVFRWSDGACYVPQGE